MTSPYLQAPSRCGLCQPGSGPAGRDATQIECRPCEGLYGTLQAAAAPRSWTTDLRADSAEAERLAMAAIELDRDDATALAVCGHTRSFLFHDYESGTALLERALQAGPSCALAWTLASCTSSYMGKGPE